MPTLDVGDELREQLNRSELNGWTGGEQPKAHKGQLGAGGVVAAAAQSKSLKSCGDGYLSNRCCIA